MDLANCYDAVDHPIASIALQNFKVWKVMVAMTLYVLETMTWYLKTAFGQSGISFGGTVMDPSENPDSHLGQSLVSQEGHKRQHHQ